MSEEYLVTYTYEDALKKSIEYFNGEELPAKVFLDKYALRNNNQELLERTPRDMHKRIAKEFARVEKGKFKNPLTEEAIFSYLDNFKYIVPQGSPMYGIGNDQQYVSLSNCFVSSVPVDSYGGILKTDQELVQISKRRGGVGTDISNLRPDGSITHNAARTSTGIVPFLERFSNSIREVGQSGRRGALMITLNCHHPQVLDFATIKRDLTKVTGANISIKLSDEFLDAVDKNKEVELRWPVNSDNPEISKKVNAREVWLDIIENAHYMAEPGLLFWDRVIDYSPADSYKEEGFETVSTNPCGEIPLCSYDSCRLMVVNLLSFVNEPFTKNATYDFDKLKEVVEVTQRLQDDMIDLEIESLDKIISKIKEDPEDKTIKKDELNLWKSIKDKAIQGRRTGTGITALGDSMAAIGIKYGSKESVKFVDKIYQTLKLGSYRSSVDMAKEIGSFPIWEHNKEKDNKFLLESIKEDDEKLYSDMKKYGRRNIACNTTAPTGSVSLLTQTTSGIEPLFMISHTRRKKINPNDMSARTDFIDQSGDHWQEFPVYHKRVGDWMKENEGVDLKDSPYYGATANDIDWPVRVKIQAAAQKHIDHSISSTINLPNNVTVEQVAEIYETAWKHGCKGITVYREGSRTGVLVDSKETKKKEPKDTNKIKHTQAPKRPKSIAAELHQFTIKKQKYYVAVGLIEDEPYEVFTGTNYNDDGEVYIPKNVKGTSIAKLQRGKYLLYDKDTDTEYGLTNGHSDPTADALTRMISTSLRHGAGISFVVDQLEKVRGELNSFSKALARALKKYIKDGTKVYGSTCSSCGGSNIIRQEGCLTCQDCGSSKCG